MCNRSSWNAFVLYQQLICVFCRIYFCRFKSFVVLNYPYTHFHRQKFLCFYFSLSNPFFRQILLCTKFMIFNTIFNFNFLACSGPHRSIAFNRRSSIGTFIRPHSSEGSQQKVAKAPPPKLDYRSMVSIDDMPELFVSFDSKYNPVKLAAVFIFQTPFVDTFFTRY